MSACVNDVHNNTVWYFRRPLLFSADRGQPPKISLFSAATDTATEN
jgi:hypothetical protein